MHKFKHWKTGTIAGALLLTITIPPAAIGAPPPGRGNAADPEQVAVSIAGPLAQGVIADPSGNPVPNIAVMVVEWPTDEDLSSLQVGNSIASQGVGLDLQIPKGASAVNSGAGAPYNCYLRANLGARNVVVGGVYASTNGHSSDLVYSAGSTTTFGVAVSATGGYGTYTSSGTTTFSADTTIGFPAYTSAGGHLLKTKFVFGRYQCYAGTTNPVSLGLRIYPMDFAGGTISASTSVPATPSTYCTPYLKGSDFEKNRTRVSSFSQGVEMKSSIGINLSSQTGFSTSTKLTIDFTANRQLCGKYAHPASITTAPGLFVVRP